MKVKYFSDTDTALIEFNLNKIAETREISKIFISISMKRGTLSA